MHSACVRAFCFGRFFELIFTVFEVGGSGHCPSLDPHVRAHVVRHKCVICFAEPPHHALLVCFLVLGITLRTHLNYAEFAFAIAYNFFVWPFLRILLDFYFFACRELLIQWKQRQTIFLLLIIFRRSHEMLKADSV